MLSLYLSPRWGRRVALAATQWGQALGDAWASLLGASAVSVGRARMRRLPMWSRRWRSWASLFVSKATRTDEARLECISSRKESAHFGFSVRLSGGGAVAVDADVCLAMGSDLLCGPQVSRCRGCT